MSTQLLAATVCSVCGEPLDNNQCLACLLRTGLAESNDSLVLGDFDIECHEDGSPWELGSGAMGVTYRARDKVLNRTVALKVISTVESQTKRDRFVREARSVAALKHPNVAAIFQFGASPETNRCYYAMELVEGETLEAIVRRDGPLKLEAALEVAIQVTRALVAAAGQGLIHRDLKPGNIMITSSDKQSGASVPLANPTDATGTVTPLACDITVKVIDFGLAKAINNVAETDLTHGEFIGTPTFASPEQFAGAPADARSDIYSLGITLWYALTGEVPYPGKTIEEIRERQKDKPLPVQQLTQRRIPAAVIDILKRTLAIDPAKRPASAQELLRQLEAYRHRGTKRKMVFVAAAAAALIVGLISTLMLRHENRGLTNIDKSIAVLPFENLSDEKEHAFFADGVQDDILTKLAKIADLKVISRTSVMQYRGKPDVRQIGNALHVSHVLEGTVRRTGAKVHLNVQLVDARSDAGVWAEEYDRDLNDVFAIETEVAQSIADRLGAKVSAREAMAMQERPTKDLVAYDYYIRAVRLIDAGINESEAEEWKSISGAIELLNQAIARDSKFLLAYCRLAEAHDELYFQSLDRTESRLALAKSAIDSAFRLKPDSGEAHFALGRHLYHCYFDYDRARDELAIALRSEPNNARIVEWLGMIDRRQNRWDNAARNFERAMELDPRNVQILMGAVANAELMRNYARARAATDRLIALEPNNSDHRKWRAWIDLEERADAGALHAYYQKFGRPQGPDFDPCYFGLSLYERDTIDADQALTALRETQTSSARNVGGAYFNRYVMEGLVTHIKGDAAAAKKAFEAARALYEKELRDDPDYGPRVVMLGMVDAALGRNREALQEGRRALELSPLTKDSLDGVDVLYFYAVTCAWTGERDLAIEELQTLAKTPGGLTYGDALFSLYWDSLRGDPRFEKIVASLKPSDVPVAFATLPEKSIAVLPFANLSSNKENAYFASGVQDELLSNLARIADLKVISRTSVTQYESSSPRNIREIGQALGVANIVEGSVQRMGNRVRVIAQLIDTRTDTHLWSETYDRDLSDVFAIQDEIAQKIADQLRAKISPREKAAIEKQPTRDLEAYKLYLEATGLIDKSGPLEGEEQKNLLLKAVELLNQAVARDPRFLLAYCRLAEAHDAFYLNGIDHTPARLALAKSAIDSAFKLEPDSGDAHLALAIHLYHGYFDYDRARDELDLALRTLPNNARIYEWSGYIDRRQNRWRDAVRNFNHALELDPQNLKILLDAQATYFNLRDYNKERQLRRRLVSLDPDYSAEKEKSLQDVLERADTRAMHAALKMKSPTEPRFELARFVLALWEHDAAEAERTLPAVSAQYADAYIARDVGSTTFSRDYLRGLIARMRGDAAAAQKAFTAARLKQEAAIRESPDINTRLSVLGLIDAGLGRKEDALREGREAVELVPPEKEAFDAADVRYYYAVICAWVGERDLAIEQLEASAKMPGGVLYHEIRLDPHWDPLRGNPRFEKIASSLTPKETKQ